MLILAAGHDPADHVLPHSFFQLLPNNLNFGLDSIPLLGFPLSQEWYFTNHLLMTLVAAVLCLLIFPWLARAYAGVPGEPARPRGALMNLLEALLQFIREEVARPVLKHRTDRFMPFLWTLFFFILFCNLLGMVPLAEIIKTVSGGRLQHVGGTATGNLAITGGLALCAFLMIHVSGTRQVYQGLITGTYGHHGDEKEHDEGHRVEAMTSGRAAAWAFPLYAWNFAPHVFAKHEPRPKPGAVIRLFMIVIFGAVIAVEYWGIFSLLAGPAGATIGPWCGLVAGIITAACAGGLHWTDVLDGVMWAFLLLLELIGAIIKPFALMIRLFANMVAGHIVLASILALIFAAKTVTMGYTVGAISTLGCVALSCLELFVALLQAYIFVFLTTLFISMSVAPEH